MIQITKKNGLTWLVFLIYGHPVLQNKPHVWDSISKMIKDPNITILVAGDFNQILDPRDKRRNTKVTIRGRDQLKALLTSLEMEELAHLGVWYTWTNNMEESDAVYERFDRAFANSSWLQLFSKSRLQLSKPEK